MNAEQKQLLPRKTFALIRDGLDLLLPLDSETSTFLGLIEGSTVQAELVNGELVLCGSTGNQIKFSKNDHEESSC